MLIDGKRALATIRVIEELRAIPDADAIEAARVGGWWTVVKTGSFNVGDLAIYIEPDAWVPTTIAPFLSKGKKPKVYEGVEGERLRTIRLRKQLSQGLLLSLDDVVFESLGIAVEGADVTEELGILKWERPIPAAMRGAMAGYFPSFIRKTDQERIQNRPELLEDQDRLWEISLKMDGSSTTIYQNDGFPGVCSRNIDLKLDATNDQNTFVRTARENKLISALMQYCEQTGRNLAMQGELMGPGIQGNRENLPEYHIYLFDIWDIDKQQYVPSVDRGNLWFDIWMLGTDRTDDIPKYWVDSRRYHSFAELGIKTMDDILALPEQLGGTFFKHWAQPIEGLVFKALDGSTSFKVINNKFLEQEK